MGETFEGERICYIEPFDAESSTVDYREPIVRCGDCKHFRSHGDDYLFCNLAARELDGGDGFCSWGERRDA